MDNIFIERLWRSLKYEAVYLHELADGLKARRVIGEWIGFYTTERPHSALGGRTPAEADRGARLGRLIDSAPTLPAAQRFAAHLDREFPAVLAFLWAVDVDATNWRAEHAIRPAVVNRKICGGNRTQRGAQTQQILASVVRTARQRGLDLNDLFTTLLQAPRPMVPATFKPAAQ